MFELRRNSRGEWCACVEQKDEGFNTVHHLRTLIVVPGTTPDSTREEALKQLKAHYKLIVRINETRLSR